MVEYSIVKTGDGNPDEAPDSACPLYIDVNIKPEGDYSFVEPNARQDITNFKDIIDQPDPEDRYSFTKRILVGQSIALEGLSLLVSNIATRVGRSTQPEDLGEDVSDKQIGYRNLDVTLGSVGGEFIVDTQLIHHRVPLVLAVKYENKFGRHFGEELSERLYRNEFVDHISFADKPEIGPERPLMGRFMFIMMERDIGIREVNQIRETLLLHGPVHENHVERADFLCSQEWPMNTDYIHYRML